MKNLQTAFLAAGLLCLFSSANAQAPSLGGEPVVGSVINRSTVNVSVTITAGNTFQQVLPSNYGTSTQRQALTIQNNNATDSCWVYLGPTASATKATSILL